MTATLISPSGAVLLHRARLSTTPAEEAEAKAVRILFRKECRLEENRTILKHRNVRAFLRAVSATLAGEPDFRQGATPGRADDPWRFQDFSTHPGTGADGVSTEAGAYRITVEAWKETGELMGLADFTPETQDLIAVELLRGLGAVEQIQGGDVWAGLLAASARWPDLPAAPGASGHFVPPATDYVRFCGVYKRFGGTINEMGGALAFGGRPQQTGARPGSPDACG